MSGTSLDGVDVALCEFHKDNEKWNYKIIDTRTYSYSEDWKDILRNVERFNAFDLVQLDKNYGKFLAEIVNEFQGDKNRKINFIASHGHTIFHQPEKGVTFQLGDGATIAANTGITTISDFRSMDVALGGQGAPLVPIGDELLFSEFDYCLNLGGFANISFNKDGKRLAFDICPANIAINYFVQIMGNMVMDMDGNIARMGKVNKELLIRLNSLEFYGQSGPKSLGKEWFTKEYIPIIKEYDIIMADILRTIYENISIQIDRAMQYNTKKSVLLTGGGVHNKFLVELIEQRVKHDINIPEIMLVDFKEALVFAFLGVLRYRNEINCLSSVTGARKDNIGGVINKI